MEAEQKSALRRCRVRMVNDIDIDQMMDVFDKRELFTSIMMEYIKSEKNRPERIRTMLDYLQRRGPQAFELFLLCLKESDHGFVASYLLQEYLKLKGVAIESCGEAVREMVTEREPEQIQTVYLAQETQGGGDDVMTEVEEPAEMELESNIPSMVQESVPPSGASISSVAVQSTTERELQSSASSNSLQVGYTRNFAEEYEMDSNPRGFLLIINNQHFNGVMTDRLGTNVDCDQLAALFMKLGFGVDVRQDLTAMEIRYNLDYLSRLDSLNNVDSLLVAILSHGSEEVIYGVDGVPIAMFDLFQPFTSEKCPSLHHKPKFFIINACRGDLEDKGAITISLRDKKTIDKDADPDQQHQVIQDIIPNLKDFIVAYSTVPKHVSWRHQNDGSWFVQSLAKVFDEFAAVKDVVSMLIKAKCESVPPTKVVLIISGNLSFLNWLTILPSLACFDDASIAWMFSKSRVNTVIQIQTKEKEGRAPPLKVGNYICGVFNISIGILIAYLSIPVVQNLVSSRQRMNTSFEPLRLVNTYGAFGSITKERTEVIFQGTYDYPKDSNATWKEYEFKCKPGTITRRPCLISPYHYRLDWLLWFAAFQNYQYNPWIISLTVKLLANDANTMSLIAKNPFKGKDPPQFVPVEHYRYKFTKIGSKDAQAGIHELRRKKTGLGCLTRSFTNRPVQLQKMARSLRFQI